ncbi:mitogen-activated protein kinase kinase 9-like [Aristolochia californica]|uniref:mitogen-activated protein kinase kinase 9-like n=1 Tax=Aristolochia californica TaxID=171875 RepID=UPI0035DF39D8
MALVRNPNLKLLLPDTRPHPALFLQPSLLPAGLTDKPSLEIGSISDLETVSILGHGNGGTVYKVRHKRSSKFYALKVVKIPSSDTESGCLLRSQVTCEMDILACTDSPQVVRCHGIFKKDATGDVALVLEYMDSGTLESLVRQCGNLSEEVLASVAKQVLLGLDYLHGLKIVHRDIKPANLLVNSKMEVKISDFGVSKIMVRRLETCASYVGTNAYMSPERFDPDTNGGSYDAFAGDIWSLGVTLWELYVGYFPLLPSGQRPYWATLMCAICFGDITNFPESASREFNDFLRCCLRKDSNKRSTVSDLLGHPFVTRDGLQEAH